MISVYDNFLPDNFFNTVRTEVMGLEFYDYKHHPQFIKEKAEHDAIGKEYKLKFPGTRTDSFSSGRGNVAPLVDSLILKCIESLGSSFSNRQFRYDNYAHLRLESDKSVEYIHQDPVDFAYLLYLSETNLDSGTKMYSSIDDNKDDENCCVKFVQNRLVIYDASTPHMAWGSYGTDISNGRLTVNGFCEYL